MVYCLHLFSVKRAISQPSSLTLIGSLISLSFCFHSLICETLPYSKEGSYAMDLFKEFAAATIIILARLGPF